LHSTKLIRAFPQAACLGQRSPASFCLFGRQWKAGAVAPPIFTPAPRWARPSGRTGKHRDTFQLAGTSAKGGRCTDTQAEEEEASSLFPSPYGAPFTLTKASAAIRSRPKTRLSCGRVTPSDGHRGLRRRKPGTLHWSGTRPPAAPKVPKEGLPSACSLCGKIV
jgi:hypothetical protein